jgi:hypothetical protein
MMGFQETPARLFYDFCLESMSPPITCSGASTVRFSIAKRSKPSQEALVSAASVKPARLPKPGVPDEKPAIVWTSTNATSHPPRARDPA